MVGGVGARTRLTAAAVLCGLHNEGVAHITELRLIRSSRSPSDRRGAKQTLESPAASSVCRV